MALKAKIKKIFFGNVTSKFHVKFLPIQRTLSITNSKGKRKKFAIGRGLLFTGLVIDRVVYTLKTGENVKF
jgi:hypothetical protein